MLVSLCRVWLDSTVISSVSSDVVFSRDTFQRRMLSLFRILFYITICIPRIPVRYFHFILVLCTYIELRNVPVYIRSETQKVIVKLVLTFRPTLDVNSFSTEFGLANCFFNQHPDMISAWQRAAYQCRCQHGAAFSATRRGAIPIFFSLFDGHSFGSIGSSKIYLDI